MESCELCKNIETTTKPKELADIANILYDYGYDEEGEIEAIVIEYRCKLCERLFGYYVEDVEKK